MIINITKEFDIIFLFNLNRTLKIKESRTIKVKYGRLDSANIYLLKNITDKKTGDKISKLRTFILLIIDFLGK